MIVHDITEDSTWTLSGPCGFQIRLDHAAPSTRCFEIATIGTRRGETVRIKSPLHARFAETLTALNRSVLVVDTRRSGCGAQGSWSPLELSTLVAEHWTRVRGQGQHEYMFLHLPILAPSVSLLGRSRAANKQPDSTDDDDAIRAATATVRQGGEPSPGSWRHWEVFREAYLQEIRESRAVLVARALVEHATAHDAVAVFLCAEPLVPDFDSCSRDVQNETCCHRFTLTRAISRSLLEAYPQSVTDRIDLSLGEPPRYVRLTNAAPVEPTCVGGTECGDDKTNRD